MSPPPSTISNPPSLVQPPRLDKPLPLTAHSWPEGTVPVVTIRCITYNHKKFIRETIEGFLMQETTFPVEILIHDDASTDGTADIIREYRDKYPLLFQTILQKENQYSRGKSPKVREQINSLISGEFIALCEGDDYWTSPSKLQKQLDFLSAHSDYTICFHNVTALPEDSSRTPYSICPTNQKESSTIEDLILSDFIPTCSMMFPRSKLQPFPEWCNKLKQGDWVMEIMLAKQGDIGYINESMACYNVHSGGAWSTLPRTIRNEDVIKFYHYINPYLDFRFDATIRTIVSDLHYELAWLYKSQGDTIKAQSNLLGYALNMPSRDKLFQAQLIKIIILFYFPYSCAILNKIKNALKQMKAITR